MSDGTYQVEDVVLIAETEKAILIRYVGIKEEDAKDGVDQFWIPRSVIEGSDLENKGDEGCVEIAMWFALKLELDTDE